MQHACGYQLTCYHAIALLVSIVLGKLQLQAMDVGLCGVFHICCLILQIDMRLMAEIKDIKSAVHPTDTLLVVDAMTGQEAATLVKTFNDELDISGQLPVGY